MDIKLQLQRVLLFGSRFRLTYTLSPHTLEISKIGHGGYDELDLFTTRYLM